MSGQIQNFLQKHGLAADLINLISNAISLSALTIAAAISYVIAIYLLVPLIENAIHRTKNVRDDIFIKRRFFPHLAHLVPVFLVYTAADLLFPAQPAVGEVIKRVALILLVLTGLKCLTTALLIVQDLYACHKLSKERPIDGYLSIIKITFYIFAGIFIIAIITDRSPWGILSLIGGLTAVLLLIFKDTILGFVASIQLFNLNMVKVGDWIEMPQYGADGDVIEVTIHTVKVQNWDKTITTIPTYSMVSNSFKNWRGMSESGGRRIKRSINIDMTSIRFCTTEMLAKFSRLSLLNDYLEKRQKDIDDYNRRHGLDPNIVPNARRQTNIGVLRAYIKAYLANNPKIHQEMTFLVRQLAPTAQGLPLEIYVFSNDQVWANYEDIQADIFDHILAMIPEFELRVFQEPTGTDFQNIHKNVAQ